MFNPATFSLPSATQLLKSHLSASNTGLIFGLVKHEGEKPSEANTIAFGHMVDGVKVRLGSISTISDDYILVLSMDSVCEFRSSGEHQVVAFLNVLVSKGFDWTAATEIAIS